MKKPISLLMMILLLLTAALAETSTPTCTTVTLATGSVQVYDFGENRLHAYVSGDALGDVCYAVESPTGVVLLESTAFTAGNDAWKAYVDTLGKPVAGKLMAYHPNGSDAYSAEAPYATENAVANWAEGGSIRALTDGFIVTFGDTVAADHPAEAQLVQFGDTLTLAGLDFVMRNEGDDAYGVEIPALNVIYIHMMGSTTHNILTSIDHIRAFQSELEGFHYALVLTGHNVPEGMDAVQAKIAYLGKTAEIAENAASAADFIAKMHEVFPDYAGENYLEMTAGFLFPAE